MSSNIISFDYHTSQRSARSQRAREVPGLYVLGSTYNVLNGRFADTKSTMQQVMQWDGVDMHVHDFGDRRYNVPKPVNFAPKTDSRYQASYGKTMMEYTKSLSFEAGLEASFPGFSASASADYSESQRENLSNAFTRIAFIVNLFTISLPTIAEILPLLKSPFVADLKKRDPIELYREYGTHLLRSLVIGGRAAFLNATDTRSYSAEMSLTAAAKISASYGVASGSMELTASQKKAMDSFNEASETTVITKGGNARYGNENFLSSVQNWVDSILDYTEFVDFGSSPPFIGLWELAATPGRRNELYNAYIQFVKLYKQSLERPGPYLTVRLTNDIDDSKNATMSVDGDTRTVTLKFPTNRSGPWYFVSPGKDDYSAVIVSELPVVKGVFAPVQWEIAFDGKLFGLFGTIRFWRAIPPTADYVALGCVGMMLPTSTGEMLEQPPLELVKRFRAVHKSALTAATTGVTMVYRGKGNQVIFAVDDRYWYADTDLLVKQDCYKLDPKMVIEEFK